MSIITENLIDSKPAMDSIQSFCNQYVTASVLSRCDIKKQADIEERNKPIEYIVPDGFDVGQARSIDPDNESPKKVCRCVAAKKLLMEYLFVFLMNFSIFRLFKEGLYFEDYKKDTLYRFLELEKANWEKLELLVAASVIADVEKDTSDDHVNVLIFDDSLYRRAGNGRKTQLCGRVYDHNDHKMRVGYRMMTGVWSNGELTIPFAQTLLTSTETKNQLGIFELRDGRTIGGKRDRRALAKGTDTVNRMVTEAQSVGIPFQYVLFDTWFCKPAQLVELHNLGADVIAMVPKTSTKFDVLDPKTGVVGPLDVKEIYSRYKKRPGKSRYLLSVTGTVTRNGVTIDVKMVYVRNRNNRKDWVCFVCTNKDLDEAKILAIYQTRWNIEVFFKMVKSHMRLTSECHSVKYDALTAHMVIVSIRYMALALDTYRRSDTRTITDLFEQAKREIINHMMNSAISVLIDCLFEVIVDMFHLNEKQIEEIYERFYDKLPEYWKGRFNAPGRAA